MRIVATKMRKILLICNGTFIFLKFSILIWKVIWYSIDKLVWYWVVSSMFWWVVLLKLVGMDPPICCLDGRVSMITCADHDSSDVLLLDIDVGGPSPPFLPHFVMMIIVKI